MASKGVETLKNMNAATGKYAKWYVRVLDPKIVEYTFTAKGETVNAKKFECVLVSKDPTQYMLGVVPFEFNDRQAADKAFAKYVENTVWEVKTPGFDTRARPDYNGCPVKSVLLMKRPTTMTAVPPTNQAERAYPALGVEIALDIKGIMAALSKQHSASGSAKAVYKVFDFCAKLVCLGPQKDVTHAGVALKVAEAEFMDAGGGKIKASAWQGAYAMLQDLPKGQGLAIIGCSAKKEEGEVKLNIWPGVHVSTAGSQAQSLTSLDDSLVDCEMLTATFTPGQDLETAAAQDAHPTCAAALAAAAAPSWPVTFQINRCMLEVPMSADVIVTQGGRPFIKNCRLRDRTGGVDVDVVRGAMPALYGCVDEEALMNQVAGQSLTPVHVRFNVRGVLREENGSTRKYIVLAEPSPLTAQVHMSSMELVLGLSKVTGDVVIPGPVERLVDEPMVGMALKPDASQDQALPVIGTFRVLLLVQGSEESICDVIDDQAPTREQIFKVTSQKVKCLLSEASATITLEGYADFKKMMAYRLDKDTALVLASAIAKPGSASSAAGEGDSFVVTVEHMCKVSPDEKNYLATSMGLEWKSVLQSPSGTLIASPLSAQTPEYWTQERSPKLRRILSEPQSPAPATST